jgi:hypothetical protein
MNPKICANIIRTNTKERQNKWGKKNERDRLDNIQKLKKSINQGHAPVDGPAPRPSLNPRINALNGYVTHSQMLGRFPGGGS